MRIGSALRCALAGAALLAAGLSTAASAAPGGARTIDVTIQNFSFQPSAITIEKGDTVRWTNQDSGVFHSAISIRPGFFTNPIGQGQVNLVVFDRPGTYDYICGVHGQQMRALIVVSGIPGPTEAPTQDPNAHVVQDTFIQARPDQPERAPDQSAFLYAAAALGVLALARFAWAAVRS